MEENKFEIIEDDKPWEDFVELKDFEVIEEYLEPDLILIS